MFRLSRSLVLSLPCLSVIFASAALANTISGVAYCNISSTDAANTPAPGTGSSGTECATFTASSLNFFSNGSYDTNNLGNFLNSGGVIVGPINYLNGFGATSTLDYSFFEFTGTAWFDQGQTYNTAHDDGTIMNIDGRTVVNAPAVTPEINTPFVFNAFSGNYAFDYTYTENVGGSAYSTDADASPTPEPTSLLLFGTGAVCLFFVVRRNRNPALSHLAP